MLAVAFGDHEEREFTVEDLVSFYSRVIFLLFFFLLFTRFISISPIKKICYYIFLIGGVPGVRYRGGHLRDCALGDTEV